MNFLEKLTLYWDLVEIDLHDVKPVRERIGSSIKNFILYSDNKTLTSTAKNIKNKDGNFKGVVRERK